MPTIGQVDSKILARLFGSSPWPYGPPKGMKISAVSDTLSAARDGRGRDYSGSVEAVRESDPRRVSEPINAHRAFARKAAARNRVFQLSRVLPLPRQKKGRRWR